MDKERVRALLREAMMIANPGEYGLGTESLSYEDDDKAAWCRIVDILEEIMEQVK